MSKNNAYQEILHAREDDGENQGFKDMDAVVMDSPFPTTAAAAAFCEDDVKRESQEAAAGMSTGVGQEEGEIYNLLDDVNDGDASMFYDFPPLPDFPCMSSSSSSSSCPITNSKPVASSSSSSSASSSSSSATSWTVLKPDPEDYYNYSEEVRYRGNDGQQYDDQAAAAAALSSTASMEISFPLPDDINATSGNGDADCINLMENFGYMDLLDNSDIWDPSSIFESENQNPQPQQQDENEGGLFDRPSQQGPLVGVVQQQQQSPFQEEGENDGLYFLQGNSELALIFLDWLKQNKDYISAQDMRSIKLKRSTIDCALKRLGTTKEGKKQLLKLILEWVEQYQLQKKRATREIIGPDHYPPPPDHYHQTALNPNPNADLNCGQVPPDPNTCFSPSSAAWAPPPPPPPPPSCVQEPSSINMATAFPPTMGGVYMCGDIPYSSAPNPSVNGNFYPPTPTTHDHQHHQYQPSPMDATTQSWNIAPPPFAMGPHPQYNPLAFSDPNIAQAMYVNAYPYPMPGERLGASATKEARKKRMARQRRISLHHYRHHPHPNGHHQIQPPQDMVISEHPTAGIDDCTPPPARNWIYWSAAAPPATAAVAVVNPTVVGPSRHAPTQLPVDRGTMQLHNHQQRSHQPSADRKQGLKTEKNLKFLLQKVLKQSDVGNLGRIVLPKKEAETHLPELESRDGISIPMEDIGTSNVWNMRYRFWPNNKSRMYLLENTGDFVRVNGLQEGDFIVIYSDTKCGKYLIRGVKVRHPGSKPEPKKPAKKNHRCAAAANF